MLQGFEFSREPTHRGERSVVYHSHFRLLSESGQRQRCARLSSTPSAAPVIDGMDAENRDQDGGKTVSAVEEEKFAAKIPIDKVTSSGTKCNRSTRKY